MRGDFIKWLGLGVAVGMAFQSAQAGDRRSATKQRAIAAARSSDFAGQMRTSGNNYAAPMKAQARGELAFFQVTPFESRSSGAADKGSRQREEPKGSGPTTSPRERKTINLLRFNPNVSVQPVIGGVNGAQLSVGF